MVRHAIAMLAHRIRVHWLRHHRRPLPVEHADCCGPLGEMGHPDDRAIDGRW